MAGKEHTSKDNKKSKSPPPAYTVHRGAIRGTCWLNSGKDGAWYSVTIARSYKDEKGEWHSANSFGVRDLLVVAEVARLCWDWIVTQTSKYQKDSYSEQES